MKFQESSLDVLINMMDNVKGRSKTFISNKESGVTTVFKIHKDCIVEQIYHYNELIRYHIVWHDGVVERYTA